MVCVYLLHTMWPPGYSTSILQVIICEAFTSKVLLHFWSGPDCTENARRCPNGIGHAGRLVSAGQYADVHCRATEQFHARACLFGEIPKNSSACRKRITPRTSQSAGFSIGTAMATAISALNTRQSPTHNCMRQLRSCFSKLYRFIYLSQLSWEHLSSFEKATHIPYSLHTRRIELCKIWFHRMMRVININRMTYNSVL